eukprot:gene999-2609_t
MADAGSMAMPPVGGDRTTADRVISHYYPNQMTIQQGSWSWDRSENSLGNFLTTEQLLWTLVSTTAWNGTLIINVGPTADGLLPPIFQQRLADIGAWLSVNKDAIYGTRPWTGSLPSGQDTSNTDVFYTYKVQPVVVHKHLQPHAKSSS